MLEEVGDQAKLLTNPVRIGDDSVKVLDDRGELLRYVTDEQRDIVRQSVESWDRCYWRRSPVTPGVTGAVRRCALAPLACNTRCYRRAAPAAPGITGGPIRGHKIYCNQSECDQVQMRCNWRLAPVTPGVTGERRQ